ncbi:type II secretion system F family protein [Candidatus Roizmanbacteria bacterium]|nr:type II secretion system F family protein [Candidatus Roizmanbacteria bacterium]
MKNEHIRISTDDKISLFISLATMLGAGITIIETIDSLLEDAKGNMKKVLTALKEDLSQGKRIHVSFSKFPNVFDKVTVSIIKAAEEAGTLDTTLKQIKENLQKEAEFLNSVRSALMYPFFIVITFLAVFLMILIVVIPKISQVFMSLKMTLPLPTKILIFLSDVLTKQTVPFLIGFSIFVLVAFLLYQTQRKRISQLFFSLPGISQIVIQIDLVRFTRSMAMLYSSGITITSSLELCEGIVMSQQVADMIHQAKMIIFSGKKLSDSLKTHKKIVPNIMIKIIEAGEKSGSLEESLREVAFFLDYQVTRTLKVLTTLIEPVMLVMVGGLVGGMMLSIIAPIYGLIGQVGAR